MHWKHQEIVGVVCQGRRGLGSYNAKRWTRAKRAWQNLNVRSGEQKHPSFVPQGQISQKALRKVVPLIMHTQLEPASGVLFAPHANLKKLFFLEYLEK